jgi:sulfur carrier protein ThiS
MIRVRVELWMDLSAELAGDFETPSAMRSFKTVDLNEGATMMDLFAPLARRHPSLAARVFDAEQGRFHPHVVVLYNERAVPRAKVEETELCHGDKVTVVPVYAGG